MYKDNIRLFVSSTFSDFQAERHALQVSVFPALRELCESHGITFQAIDLRWGVSAEHVNRYLTMDVCLDEVRRCLMESAQPNFLGLLGNRWGWQPVPKHIRVELFNTFMQTLHGTDDALFLEKCYPLSSLDENALPHSLELDLSDSKDRTKDEIRLRKLLETHIESAQLSEEEKLFLQLSATAMEFHAALIENGNHADLEQSALVIERSITDLPLDAGSHPYLDIDNEAVCEVHSKRLGNLKELMRTLLPESRLQHYFERWIGHTNFTDGSGLNPEITHQGLNDFSQLVLSTLTEQIQVKIRDLGKRKSEQIEQELHTRFGAEASRIFAGRQADLAALSALLQTQGQQSPPTLILGRAGGGTTTLIARSLADFTPEIKLRVIVRYVNASPSASSAKSLIADLFKQIQSNANVPNMPSRIKMDLFYLLSESPCFVIIDGIDHLETQDAEWLLTCFPEEIPHGSAVIFSCASSSPIAKSGKIGYMRKLEIGSLGMADGKSMLSAWLGEGLRPRSLTDKQNENVLEAFNSAGCSPLYLRLATLIARRWKHFDPIQPLATNLGELIRKYFQVLISESLHGPIFLRRALSLIAASRSGIAEVELLDILSSDEEVLREYHDNNPFAPQIGRLPDIVWSRLYSEIRPFLSLSEAQTRPVICFRHREFQQTVTEQMLTGSEGLAIRTQLIGYFEIQRNLVETGSYSQLRTRPFYEIPWQLLNIGNFKALKDFLIQPDVISMMMDSFSIDPNRNPVVGNLVRDLAMYWTTLGKNGYPPSTALLESIDLLNQKFNKSMGETNATLGTDIVDIRAVALGALTIKINRLLGYMGDKQLGGLSEFLAEGDLEGLPLDDLGKLFESKCKQAILMNRIKDDVKKTGYTNRERENRLKKLIDELKGAKNIAQEFVCLHEPGAHNFDSEFGVNYLGAINWLPIAYSYYLLEQPDRAIATFQDVLERLSNAPGQEFLQYQINVEIDCATAMRSVGRYDDACERLLTAVALMDANGAGWQDRIPELLDNTFDIATEAELSTNQLSILRRLATYKTKYFLGGEDVLATINLLKIITHHPLQAESEYDAKIQELLLKACRVGLGKYMDAKMFDETRQWATYCLPIYEKVFGVHGDRTQALRRILETS